MNSVICEDCSSTGVHGISVLERHDECGRFESDGEAQAFTRTACQYHDPLVRTLAQFIEYLGVAGDDGAYDKEIDAAVALLTACRQAEKGEPS